MGKRPLYLKQTTLRINSEQVLLDFKPSIILHDAGEKHPQCIMVVIFQHSISIAKGQPFSDPAIKNFGNENLKGWNSALGKTDFLIRFAGKPILDLLARTILAGTLHRGNWELELRTSH